MRNESLVAVMLAGAALAGCVSVKPVVLDQKTQLENQMLGTFKRLEEDLILASSVRGGRAEAKISPLRREALEAMMTREFNRDDIEELKTRHVVGEGNDGMLAIREAPGEAAQAARVKQLVKEENAARLVLINRVIQESRELDAQDLPLVRRMFYRLNLQTARPGDQVQQAAGKWVEVQASK